MSSSINQLRNIISATPSAIAIVDQEMKYIAVSDRWIQDYHLDGKTLIGECHYKIFPEITDEWKQIHKQALQGVQLSNEKDQFVRENGTEQWLSWEVSPWFDEGKVAGLVMATKDITEEVDREKELSRNLKLYHETNNAARIGAWEYDLIQEKVYWSPVVRQIYEVDDSFIRDFSNTSTFFKEEDKATVDGLLTQVTVDGKAFDHDYEIITAKGNSRWVRIRGNPHFDDGRVVRVSGTIQDIQELKMKSILLTDSEEKYKSILENSLHPHFLIRPDGYILEANKAGLDMFGYSKEEMRELNRADLMDSSDPNLEPYLKKRNDTGSAKAELTGIRKGGERFPLEISSVSFTDSNGVLRTSVSILDITERKKAEDNLRLSEAEFRAAFEYSALGMSLMDISGKWIRVNESFCRILGYTNRELMSLSLRELSHPDDREKDAQMMGEVLEGKKKSFQLEKRYLHKDGGTVWVHQAVSVVQDINYQPSHWTVQIQDITEQKNIENALREERELLRTLIDNIPLSIFIKDLKSRKTLVNKAECKYAGVKDASEILGKNDFELYPASYATVAVAEDQEVFKTRKAIINREKVVTWKDDTVRHILVSKIPLYDKGKVSGLLGITYDITKIREAEHAVFESEQKFRRIFENIQDVFYQTDQEGIVTEISPSIEKHSGYTREEVIGKQVTDFYYNVEDRQALVDTIRTARIVSDFEVRLKTKAGQQRYSSVNAQLIIRNGEVIGTEGSMRDVTERKRFEDSLKALNADLNTLNEQKNKLLSVIAHDLRNPIAGSAGLLEVVFSDAENVSREELLEYMSMMQKGIVNAHELLEDLLEWAKIQFHSVDFHPVLVSDLARDVRHTIKKIEPIAEAKRISIVQNIKEGLDITVDKHMLASIIRNLVTNAIKFTNRDGEIKVSVTREGNGYLFSVSDNGVGIPEKDLDKLFSNDTGFTSYGTLGEKGTGMGLGLCRSFVEKHGGRIWVESVIGEGSNFYFTIPDRPKSTHKLNR